MAPCAARRLSAGGVLSAALLSISWPGPLHAQPPDLAAERARVLTVAGTVKDVSLPLFPLAEGPGLGFVQNVSEPQALSLRLRFTLEPEGPGGEAWGVHIKDASGASVWSTWAERVTRQTFWSPEIKGHQLTVEVYSSRAGNPVRLRIDKLAIERPPIKPLSTVGENQLTPIGSQDPWIVDAGKAVARVRFVGDDGGSYVCTAFLVTSDLMFTNQHCIASESEMDSALVDFDFDTAGSKLAPLTLSQLLQTDYGLDYALVRLSEPVERAPLRVDQASAAADQQLLVIQHPGGEPKQVSLLDCKVSAVSTGGRAGSDTDFGHECDTKGGSSGSPVLRFDSRTIVGLHHLGFKPNDSNLYNRAVHVDRVLADLSPEHRIEVTKGQQELLSPPGP